ncbi:uncharacterized protein E0L32_010728 [Thyridium curvatum]|uniref:Uncharacterized protein n=1 Tax=Thyridium curvatum TaxID=1093900 RepID=A0A507ARW3_9PEZI|nr:uncharacterized protein E0L32_010728 [Thyridium curvatum]TPX07629.1 hypothetical protein E0L32_010728 [Thyridium curvatum]
MDDAEKSTSAAAADPPTQEASISNWPSTLHPTIESLLSSPAELPQDSASLADRGVFCVPGSDQYQDLFLLRAPSSNVVETIRDLLENFRSDDCDRPGRFAFYNVSPADFKKFYEEEPRVRKCKLTYLASELGGLLSFKMPSVKHNTPADVMLHDLVEQARGMHRYEMVLRIGNADLKLKDSTSIKQPDEGIISIGRPDGITKPTVVVEVGNSQSKASLIRDKNTHFQKNDDPNLVILIKVSPNRHRKMEVELWRRGDDEASSSVTVSLAEPLSDVTKVHCRTAWNVTGAPMIIRFEDVMAYGKEDEYDTDFIFSEDCFIEMAGHAVLVCPKTPRQVLQQYSEHLSKLRAQKIEQEEKEARQKEQIRQDNDVLQVQVRLLVEELGRKDEQIRQMREEKDEQIRQMREEKDEQDEQVRQMREEMRQMREEMRQMREEKDEQDEQIRQMREQMRQ